MSVPDALSFYLVIDFDSTFTKVEALDELAAIALENHPDGVAVVGQIRALTNLGMSGEIGIHDSLGRRLQLLEAERGHLPALVARLRSKVSDSIESNADFFRRFAERIYVVSSGFREFIEPVVADFGIAADHVLANSFTFNSRGRITGCERGNVLSQDGGKCRALRDLGLEGEIYVIGDGWTDYEIRTAGVAQRFYAFTENVARPEVIAKADRVLRSFDEFLEGENLR